MIRYEIRNPDGTLKSRVEIERLQDGATVWFRRYDAADVLIEDREATARERANLERQESAEYHSGLRDAATQAIDVLQAHRTERQAILNNDATNIAQVNTALDMLANHMNTMHVVLTHLIRLTVRREGS